MPEQPAPPLRLHHEPHDVQSAPGGRVHDDFIAVASHELRTPISVVHGIASTLYLRGNELRAGQLADLRAKLYEQTSRLRDLADQLLDLSRLEGGSVVVHPVCFRPRERVDELLPRIAPDRLDQIGVEIPPELEVTTDPVGFERIVSNLVLNAFGHGRPPVRVTAEAGEGFTLAVEDRGDGVEPSFVPRLFDRFARGRGARGGERGGAGLGLAIARSYAEALGGDLRYEPAQPHGARFVLELA